MLKVDTQRCAFIYINTVFVCKLVVSTSLKLSQANVCVVCIFMIMCHKEKTKYQQKNRGRSYLNIKISAE